MKNRITLILEIIFIITLIFLCKALAQVPSEIDRDLILSQQYQRYYFSGNEQQLYHQEGTDSDRVASFQGNWESLDFSGGDVNSMLINTSGYIFAATYTGVFRSTDNGATWEDINVNLGNGTAICLAENSSGQIFLGNVDGIYRSDDNGDTWSLNPLLEIGAPFESITISDNDIIYAGSFLTAQGNLFRSTDNGATWENISILSASIVTALQSVNDTTILAGGLLNGIYISTDNGNSWTPTNINQGYFRQFAINSFGDIYADGFSLDGSITGIYKSTDHGRNWKRLANQFENLNIKGIAINSNDEIFVGVTQSKEIYHSSDNGVTWNNITNNLILNFGTHWLTASDSLIVIASVGEGIFYSSDKGKTWDVVGSGLYGYKVEAIDTKSNGTLFVGTTPGGIYYSTDDGINWDRLNSGLTSPVITSIAINKIGDIFLGTETGGIFRSTDDGNTWIQINSGLPNGNEGDVYAITIDTTSSNEILYVSTGGSVYWSVNNGNSWEPYDNGLNGRILEVKSNQQGEIFAGTDFSGIYRSVSGSGTWMPINSGLQSPPLPITGITFGDPDNVFCSMGGVGIFGSSNNGNNWALTTLTDPAITDLENNLDRDLFAGSGSYTTPPSNNVYVSTNNGNSWESIANNVNSNSPVTTISVDYQDRLIAGTWNNGVHRWNDNTTEVNTPEENILLKYDLLQNYPNPFNPSTTIKYSIPSDGFVVLRVFSVIGEEVKMLVSEFQKAGSYQVTFDATNLSSGIYFYRLEVNELTKTRKMILLE